MPHRPRGNSYPIRHTAIRARDPGVKVPSGVEPGAIARPDHPRVGHRRRGGSPGMSTATAPSPATPAPRRLAGESAR
jgi:hypothetical protein